MAVKNGQTYAGVRASFARGAKGISKVSAHFGLFSDIRSNGSKHIQTNLEPKERKEAWPLHD